MKRFFLLLLFVLPVLAHAQGIEIGVVGGLSFDSKPTDNMYYKGEKAAANWSAGINVLKNFDKHWQVCVDLQTMKLSRHNTIGYNALYLHPVVEPNKTFVYANVASSFCTEVNYKVFAGPKQSYFYGGLAVGLCYAVGNSHDESAEVPYRGPSGGFGISGGAQVGYAYNISPSFIFKLQGAMRYMNLSYDAIAPFVVPNGTHLHYGIIAYPITIGFSYKFDHHKEVIGTRKKATIHKSSGNPAYNNKKDKTKPTGSADTSH